MIDVPSPHYSRRDGHEISMVIVHGTGTMSTSAAVSWICDERSRVSYHYLIGRDGKLFRLVDEKYKAWHAGRSSWHGREVGVSVNPIAIGIALTGDGTEPYTDAQYWTLADLLADLMARYRIPPSDVRGHDEVAPGRKTDPYPCFEWRRVLGEVGER